MSKTIMGKKLKSFLKSISNSILEIQNGNNTLYSTTRIWGKNVTSFFEIDSKFRSDIKRNGILLTRCWTFNWRSRITRNNCTRVSHIWNCCFILQISFLEPKVRSKFCCRLRKVCWSTKKTFDEQNERLKL